MRPRRSDEDDAFIALLYIVGGVALIAILVANEGMFTHVTAATPLIMAQPFIAVYALGRAVQIVLEHALR